jgi:hypothetical protein
MNMHRLFGTILLAGVLLLSATQAGFSYDSPQKYGIQLGGGFGVYDMGDIPNGADYLLSRTVSGSLTEADSGPMGSFALLYRPSRHQMWEIGYNAILDVENKVETSVGDSLGQLLMHANEFYVKANIVSYPSDKLHLNFGVGLAYYNVEMQVQNAFGGVYAYDAVGRGWGVLGTLGLEYLLKERVGLYLGGGGRLMNASHFSYESVPGVRSVLEVVGGGDRPMEVNLTGAYGQIGLRFYFDKVTKPIDFSR